MTFVFISIYNISRHNSRLFEEHCLIKSNEDLGVYGNSDITSTIFPYHCSYHPQENSLFMTLI